MKRISPDAPEARSADGAAENSAKLRAIFPELVTEGREGVAGNVDVLRAHVGDATVTDCDEKWRYSKDSISSILEKLEPKRGRNALQIIFSKDSGTMRSVWQAAKYDSSEYGTKLVEGMIGEAGFTFPKSLWAVRDALRIMTDDGLEAIVIDFFAGGGTTGHALWEIGKELRQPLNIAELTKERLRRAAKTIREENPLFEGDLGFRVFKFASTNIREWEPDRGSLEETLEESDEHLKTDRTEQDILYELLLKLGLDLCVPIEKRVVAGKDVHAVGGSVRMACLAKRIERDDVEPLAQGIVAWHTEPAPAGDTTCVFRDSAFVDDVAKTNLAAILNQHGVTNVRSL